MFPRDFFLDYWSPLLRDEVFVAMPFAPEFTRVWEKAITPASERCGLKPFRVDMRKTSDSILVDILDGVAHARLIVVDLSPVSFPPMSPIKFLLGNVFRNPQFPNGNVMYELGLAHATRQAEEVILVHNQTDTRLLFDVSGVRAHSYPPGDIEAASKVFEDLMRDALTTIDSTKALQVGKAVKAISIEDIKLIRKYWPYSFMVYAKNPDDDLRGIPHSLSLATADLQRLGVLYATPLLNDEKFSINLTWTEFGNAVVKALGPRILQGRPDPTVTLSNSTEQKVPANGNNMEIK